MPKKTIFLLIFLLTLTVRVLFLIFAPMQYKQFGDTDEYLEVAKRLCTFGKYPFEHFSLPTFRAPGFPIFLAITSGCFSVPDWWIKTCLIVLDSVSCLLGMGIVYYLSKEMRAVIFGIAYALYPHFIQQATTVESEALTLFSILACLFLFVRAYSKNSLLFGIASGICLGISILTRPSSLVLFFPVLIALIFGERQVRKIAVVTILGAALTLSPWSIYATFNTGKYTLVNDSFCYSIYRGARLELIDVYQANDAASFKLAAERSEQVIREAEKTIKDDQWCKETIKLIANDPYAEIKLAVMKFFAFFRPWPHKGSHNLWIVFTIGSVVSILYALFLISLLQGKNSKKIMLTALAYILLSGFLHIPHQVSNRYRVPYVDPIMMLIVAAYLYIPKHKVRTFLSLN